MRAGGKLNGWKRSGFISGASANKYGAKKTDYNGHKYHSKKEADYARSLDWKLKTGEILKWDRQVSMQITVNGEKICRYICDFVVTYPDRVEHIDVKGMKSGIPYEHFKLKKKLVKATLGIDIIEK